MSTNEEADIADWYQSVYADTHKIVYRYGEALIYRHCRDLIPELDDLVQETFEDLFRKRKSLRQHENITGWLIVAFQLNFKNRLRKWRIWRSRSAEVDTSADIFSVQADSFDAAAIYENEGALAIMREAIGDEEKYDAFLAYYIRQVPIKALAERKGVSEAAMKMQLYRCRKLCHTALKATGKLTILLVLIRVTLKDFAT